MNDPEREKRRQQYAEMLEVMAEIEGNFAIEIAKMRAAGMLPEPERVRRVADRISRIAGMLKELKEQLE